MKRTRLGITKYMGKKYNVVLSKMEDLIIKIRRLKIVKLTYVIIRKNIQIIHVTAK